MMKRESKLFSIVYMFYVDDEKPHHSSERLQSSRCVFIQYTSIFIDHIMQADTPNFHAESTDYSFIIPERHQGCMNFCSC